jgi:hypothetical protein
MLESWDPRGIHISGAWDAVGYSKYNFWITLYLHHCRRRNCLVYVQLLQPSPQTGDARPNRTPVGTGTIKSAAMLVQL